MAKENLTAVSAAIGTQRQFHKQEASVYKMSLKTPTFTDNMTQGADIDAQRLVAALSNFGDAMWRERVAYDKRQEERDTRVANKVWQETKAEDREQLSSMELINNYAEGYHASDNSYAIAKLDEMRGGYISSKIKQEYLDTVLPQDENQPKTAQENISRYEKFVNGKMQELTKSDNSRVINQTAFSKGFYGNRPNDILQVDDAFRKKKQAEFEADRDAYISTKVSELNVNSINKTPDELKADVQEFLTDSKVTAVSLDKRFKIFNELLKGIASNGNTEQIDALSDVIIAYRDDGSPILAKNSLALDDYKYMATKAMVGLNEQKHRDFVKSLEGLSSGAIAEEYNKLKLKDPLMWKAEAPNMDNIIKAAEKAERKERKDALTSQAAVLQNNFAKSTFMNRYSIWVRGGAFDSYDGRGVSDKSFLFNGKNKTIPEEVAIAACSEIMTNNHQNLPFEEACVADMKLLQFPLAYPYLKEMKERAEDSLSSVTTGTTEMSEGLKRTMGLYRADPNMFTALMPKNVANDYRTLNRLIDIYGEQIGLQKYGRYKEVQTQDPDTYDTIKDARRKEIEFNGSVSLSNYAGTDRADLDVNSGHNSSIRQDLAQLMDVYIASGMTADAAKERAMADLDKSYVNIDGDAIGKSFFSYANVPNKEQLCNDYVEEMKANVVGHSTNILGRDNTAREKVGVVYNRGNNSILLYMKDDHTKADGTKLTNGDVVGFVKASDFAKNLVEHYVSEQDKEEAKRTKQVTVADVRGDNSDDDVYIPDGEGGD